ncbi:MAG: tRNA methyltransferase [Holosporales bacterium]|jgi:tRNA (cytidine/uridine-2'-O-)-methyltransferase|nr:tRNA methyltransferase [Holosporales bacterium]
MIQLAFYQPEIPHNTGALLRLSACLGNPFHIVGPTGFLMSEKHLQRASLDYGPLAQSTVHDSPEAFWKYCRGLRVVALVAQAGMPYTAFSYTPSDILLLGSESTGLPPQVLHALPDRVTIPMLPQRRSLNAALAGAIVLTEALRQCGLLPQQTAGGA